MVDITINNLDEVLANFHPDVVKKAVRATLTRVATSGKAIAAQLIYETWNIKLADIRKKIEITNPRLDDLKARLSFEGGKGISLSYFNPQQLLSNRGFNRRKNGDIVRVGYSERALARKMSRGPMPSGVLVQLKRGGEKTFLRHSFLAKVKAGASAFHIGVFRRKSDSTMPARVRWTGRPHAQRIEEKGLITIASLVQEARIIRACEAKIKERILVELPAQLEYFQSRVSR